MVQTGSVCWQLLWQSCWCWLLCLFLYHSTTGWWSQSRPQWINIFILTVGQIMSSWALDRRYMVWLKVWIHKMERRHRSRYSHERYLSNQCRATGQDNMQLGRIDGSLIAVGVCTTDGVRKVNFDKNWAAARSTSKNYSWRAYCLCEVRVRRRRCGNKIWQKPIYQTPFHRPVGWLQVRREHDSIFILNASS